MNLKYMIDIFLFDNVIEILVSIYSWIVLNIMFSLKFYRINWNYSSPRCFESDLFRNQ